MTTLTADRPLLTFIILAFICLFIALKWDKAKIKITWLKEPKYGMTKAILFPLSINTIQTVICIWRLKIELRQTYPDIKQTKTYHSIKRQTEPWQE
ncbi:MAG: hypothetical protein VYB44_07420 [Bacteroidota bacterium]|nr:hypothetical protein [Bacteroidota bacterium]